MRPPRHVAVTEETRVREQELQELPEFRSYRIDPGIRLADDRGFFKP
jgi:hypothetical protein